MRKTKIVATLGPATSTSEMISRLMEAGVSVFRLNFSHADHEFLRQCVDNINALRHETGRAVSILADLQGPKIRTGILKEPTVNLVAGDSFVLTTADIEGDEHRVSTNYPGLAGDVAPGDPILVDDGKLRLKVERIEGDEVHTIVVSGGELAHRKALNLPGTRIKLPALTEKDKRDLRFAIEELNVDFIALSFVRSPSDIDLLKVTMEQMKANARVIIKIEKPQAVENFDAIISSLELGDGIMIARGDLGVEVDIERVPALQKRMITKANQSGMICITATQMLESLIDQPLPSRAEASDIFNAVLDGTDAVMLSGETAIGRYPEQAVQHMVNIICQAESFDGQPGRGSIQPNFCDSTFSLATVRAACAASEAAGASAITALTYSGRTAVLMSKLSLPGRIPFFALTPRHSTYNKLALLYGVHPLLMPNEAELGEDLWEILDRALIEKGGMKKGNTVVIASGYKISDGYTNSCKIVKLGDRQYY